MENKALEIVKNWINKHIVNDSNFNIFVVWSCYILGNRKYLIGTTIDNKYYEVTYNKAKDEYYLDVYEKIENECIKLN